ncbi:MAG: cell filamentation protein Fic, partial [Saprospiraceae bacterium]
MTSFDNILSLIDTYKSLGLTEVIDYNKFNYYAITHHSTVIEGSSLSETETRLLLDEDITPKGKPLTDSLMT